MLSTASGKVRRVIGADSHTSVPTTLRLQWYLPTLSVFKTMTWFLPQDRNPRYNGASVGLGFSEWKCCRRLGIPRTELSQAGNLHDGG